MSTISVSDLKKKPAKQWRASAKKSEVVVTSEGEPLAVLLPVDAATLQPTLSTLRSVRALRAQAALHKAAAENGTDKLTMDDIDSEITAARRARRTK
jgi:prevent-host-death family protein